jgi:hypothetical protein
MKKFVPKSHVARLLLIVGVSLIAGSAFPQAMRYVGTASLGIAALAVAGSHLRDVTDRRLARMFYSGSEPQP